MQRNIRALVVKPYELPEEKMIKNSLEAKQEIVEGYIEYAYMLDDPSVVLICNEEGKLEGKSLNRDIGHDIIAGTFIIAGDNDTGEDRSLTDDQIKKYQQRFNEKSITDTDAKINEIYCKKITSLIEKECEI
jgi:hypothetical protein